MTAKLEGVMYLQKKDMHLNAKNKAFPETVVRLTKSPVLDSAETSVKSMQRIRAQIREIHCYIWA